jgi:uncharacterized protein (DUF952 family)
MMIERERSVLLHVASVPDYEAAIERSEYCCQSLSTEGFIHCCEPSQFAGVVDRYFKNAGTFMLVIIDEAALPVGVVRENTVGGTELFPHLYTPLPLAAVLDAFAFDTGDLDAVYQRYPQLR